jgi:hypothetical protein
MLHRAAMSVPRRSGVSASENLRFHGYTEKEEEEEDHHHYYRSNVRTAPVRSATTLQKRGRKSKKLRQAGREYIHRGQQQEPYRRHTKLSDFHTNKPSRNNKLELSIRGQMSKKRNSRIKRIEEIDKMRRTYTKSRAVKTKSPRHRFPASPRSNRFVSPPPSRRSVESYVDDHEVDELIQWTSKLDMTNDTLEDFMMHEQQS